MLNERTCAPANPTPSAELPTEWLQTYGTTTTAQYPYTTYGQREQ